MWDPGGCKTRINGWRLKPYFSQTMEDPAETAQVSFVNDEPLGEIAQDPLNAQHVPCIESMSLGPTTRPCIGTDLGTTDGHLSIGGEDECRSRLQSKDDNATEGLDQEA